MKVVGEFNYRHAKELLLALQPALYDEIIELLSSEDNKLNLGAASSDNTQRQLSTQIQKWFEHRGYTKEKHCFSQSVKDLKYDLVKDNIPIEIEIGHERLVYADFFKFLTDYTNEAIPLGVMIVAAEPKKFGHIWHNSLDSTKKKILAIGSTYLVPVLVIAVNP